MADPVKHDYNTVINVIGSLHDCGVIFKAIQSHFSQSDSVNDLIWQRNEFNLRTEKSRSRIESAITNTFLQFRNPCHEELINSISKANIPETDKNFILFWMFVLNNELFRLISLHVFIKMYSAGRSTIKSNDIVAYLKEFMLQNKSLQLGWSESTVKMLGTKYLAFMSKIKFLSDDRVKKFLVIRPSSEVQVLFLYFAKIYFSGDILKNELLPLSFISLDDLQDRLKKLSLKGFFNMDFNGVILNTEFIHSYKGVCDVLYK